jgi:lysophospholipase L1-like esterase
VRFHVSSPSDKITPNPLISRGLTVALNPSGPGATTLALTNGLMRENAWFAPLPASAVIQVPAGPTQVLVRFRAATNPGFDITPGGSGGVPMDYKIETSPDGELWTVAADVTDNIWAEVVRLVPFTGMGRIRVTISKVDNAGANAFVDELDVHDASNGAQDTWIFLGDSITAGSYTRADVRQPSFAELVKAAHPDYFPLMVNGGVGATASPYGLDHMDEWLAVFPDVHYWVLGWGTNESGTSDATEYKARMQTLIDKVKAAGRVPVIPHVPFQYFGSPSNPNTNTPFLNTAIDQLTAANGLVSGPDSYAWFSAHPEELSDGTHPTDAGARSLNRLWAEAMDGLYNP